jgi:predicted regulator of Ras-like GTPase activity (Roadblock/LC7/MglB family)
LFEEIFKTVYEKNKEIKAIGVWGKDGLELEKKYFSQGKDIDVDLELSGAEMADIIARLDNTKISPHFFIIKLSLKDYLVVIVSLTSDYFLMVIADPGIIEGKLNFYLNLYKNKLISAL